MIGKAIRGELLFWGLLSAGAYFLYKRLGLDVAIPSGEEIKRGLRDIAVGLPSAVGSIVRGESADRYISTEEQRRRAQVYLKQKMGQRLPH